MLDRPAEVQIARRNAPIELVRQVVYPVDRERKRELLSHLIKEGRIDRALVFTRTKHGANRLAEQLEMDGIAATAIHGNKSQGQRVRALDDFKSGRVSILVATEVASRGLDIEGLPHVVNFELPMVAQDYVHRIGRTGRAGMEGDAVSLVCIDENMLLDDIQSLLRQPIRREIVPGFEVNRSIPREPIRQRSTGVYRPSEGRRAPARQAAPARPVEPAGIRNPAPAEFRQPAPAASRPPARNGTGFTPRQPVPTGIRQPAPSGFAARRADPRGPRQAPSGEYRQAAAPIGFNQSAPVTPRRPAAGGFRRPMPSDFDRGPSSSSSQSRPSNGPANRQSNGRPAGGGNRQPERRYPAPESNRRGAVG
jgi:ATP-dependent RNA helicase RhlE